MKEEFQDPVKYRRVARVLDPITLLIDLLTCLAENQDLVNHAPPKIRRQKSKSDPGNRRGFPKGDTRPEPPDPE